jgi:hypothetical protein
VGSHLSGGREREGQLPFRVRLAGPCWLGRTGLFGPFLLSFFSSCFFLFFSVFIFLLYLLHKLAG